MTRIAFEAMNLCPLPLFRDLRNRKEGPFFLVFFLGAFEDEESRAKIHEGLLIMCC